MPNDCDFHHSWFYWFEDFDCNFRRDQRDHKIFEQKEQNSQRKNSEKQEKLIKKQK